MQLSLSLTQCVCYVRSCLEEVHAKVQQHQTDLEKLLHAEAVQLSLSLTQCGCFTEMPGRDTCQSAAASEWSAIAFQQHCHSQNVPLALQELPGRNACQGAAASGRSSAAACCQRRSTAGVAQVTSLALPRVNTRVGMRTDTLLPEQVYCLHLPYTRS